MPDDGPQLSLGEHAKQREPDQQGPRPAPGHHAAARQIGQADLGGRFDPQAPAHLFDRREKERRVDPGQNRAEIAVGVVGLDREPHAPQRTDDIGPAIDFVAEPAPRHGNKTTAQQQDQRTNKRSDPVHPRSAAATPSCARPARNRRAAAPGSACRPSVRPITRVPASGEISAPHRGQRVPVPRVGPGSS